ncbi:MAG: proteasome subunit beta [Candidatus Diapherotrites archaeon]|nr:proteasome subunit beta [Candidatus Diapherotrites archaeon]
MVEDVKTGTTTIGLKAANAIVLAADQRASMGHIAIDEDAEKIYEITKHVAVTNAGNVGDSLTIIRFLRSQAKLYELAREEKMTAKAMSTFISNILNANRYYPFIVQLVVGGMAEKPELFEITPFGGVVEKNDYAVSGSGTELALSTLDSQYKKGMNENEAALLAVKAITAGKRRDIYSGGKSITVVVIDSRGVRFLPKNEVEKFISMV